MTGNILLCGSGFETPTRIKMHVVRGNIFKDFFSNSEAFYSELLKKSLRNVSKLLLVVSKSRPQMTETEMAKTESSHQKYISEFQGFNYSVKGILLILIIENFFKIFKKILKTYLSCIRIMRISFFF